jgi:hypothetical protein
LFNLANLIELDAEKNFTCDAQARFYGIELTD